MIPRLNFLPIVQYAPLLNHHIPRLESLSKADSLSTSILAIALIKPIPPPIKGLIGILETSKIFLMPISSSEVVTVLFVITLLGSNCNVSSSEA
ncbi:MAG: hypothetical protein JRJ23_01745 [Deltaproteobacteria bacterium]|nr:hypothetical protein [Deltaproteobacteria bacterium]